MRKALSGAALLTIFFAFGSPPTLAQTSSVALPTFEKQEELDRIPIRELKEWGRGIAAPRILPIETDGLHNSTSIPSIFERRKWVQQVIDDEKGGTAVTHLAKNPSEVWSLVGANSGQRQLECSQLASSLDDTPGLTAKLETGAVLTNAESSLAKSYVRACFRGVFDDTSPVNLKALRTNAAVLEYSAGQEEDAPRSYCSALLVNATAAATARHCLYSSAGRMLSLDAFKIIPLGLPRVQRIAVRIKAAFAIRGQTNQFRWTQNIGEDFILLELATPVTGMNIRHVAIASDSEINAATRSYQLGFHASSFSAQSKSENSLEALREAYLADDSKYCVAIRNNTRCIVQGCQSLRQTSGAAFLIEGQDTLKLAGTLFGAPRGIGTDNAECFDIGTLSTYSKSSNISSRAHQ